MTNNALQRLVAKIKKMFSVSKGAVYKIGATSVKFNWNQQANRFSTNLPYANEKMMESIIEDTRQYVPYDTGELNSSAMVDDGEVVYDTDYAGIVYNMTEATFQHDVHPNACSEWLERSTAENKDRWIKEFGERWLG